MSYPASQRRSLLQEARCQTCSLSSLCLPLALELEDMSQFDAIIRRRSPLKKGSTVTPSAPTGALATRSLNAARSRPNSSRTRVVAEVTFMVQISGSQPPVLEQKLATMALSHSTGVAE